MLNNITVQGTLSTLYAPINSNVNVATTTGEHVALIASSSSNGTAANGFGTRIALRTESSTTAARDSGAISALWSDATDATRTSDLLFYNALNGTLTERMRILGTNGNVGIGTTTPSVRLHIEGSANPTTLIRNTSTTGYSQIIFANTSVTNTGFWLNGSAQSDYGGLNSLNGYIGAGVFAFHTASVTNAFTLLQNGNLGIGTVTPTEKLEISGGNILASGTITGTSGLKLGVSTSLQTPNGGLITWGSMNSSGGNTLTFSGFTDSIFFNNSISVGANRLNLQAAYIQSISTGGPNNVPTLLFSSSQGSDAGNPIFRFSSNSSYAEHILFGVGSGTTYSEYLTIRSNGKIGIGTTSPAARLDIADTTLAGSGSLAGSILNLAQTWNTTGAPTAIKLNVTNTASGAASNLLDLQVDTVSKFKVNKLGDLTLAGSTGVTLIGGGGFRATSYIDVNIIGLITSSSGGIGFSSGGTGATYDTALFRDAAGTLALRNGVNPQTFRLYNTYTDATTFERLNIKWDTNVLKIGTEKGTSGGTARSMELQTDGVTRMTLGPNGNVYIAGFVNPAYLRLQYGGGGNCHMYCPGDGMVTLYNLAETGFNRIQLGGITSSFPAIKRNGAAIQIRLADDSANAALETGGLTVVGSASVSGHFSATTKSFLIPHPTKPDKKLQYACLEGPENGVYIRGKTNEPIILLPDYWSELVDADSITVTVTPIGKPQQLFVVSQNSTSVEIGNVDGLYNYLIFAERKDVNKLQTEI
jgi:hypothetical protein